MEAAAVAWACEQHGTPLVCIKVVTDLVDGGGVGEVRNSGMKELGRVVFSTSYVSPWCCLVKVWAVLRRGQRET